jgi:hypothetical protein
MIEVAAATVAIVTSDLAAATAAAAAAAAITRREPLWHHCHFGSSLPQNPLDKFLKHLPSHPPVAKVKEAGRSTSNLLKRLKKDCCGDN